MVDAAKSYQGSPSGMKAQTFYKLMGVIRADRFPLKGVALPKVTACSLGGPAFND